MGLVILIFPATDSGSLVVEHRADRCGVTEQFTPVVHRTIGCQQLVGAFVAAHDNLRQVLGRDERQFAHAEVVDHMNSGTVASVSLYCFFGALRGEFLEQHVRLAVSTR
jgi:hypothetical protein